MTAPAVSTLKPYQLIRDNLSTSPFITQLSGSAPSKVPSIQIFLSCLGATTTTTHRGPHTRRQLAETYPHHVRVA